MGHGLNNKTESGACDSLFEVEPTLRKTDQRCTEMPYLRRYTRPRKLHGLKMTGAQALEMAFGSLDLASVANVICRLR